MNKLPNLVYSEERKEKVMLMDSKSKSEINFIEFKTNIIMKFAKSLNMFKSFPSYFDNLNDTNKHYVKDCYYKLKILLEKRESVLFDFEKLISNFNLANNLVKWKDYLEVFYNFENLMGKMLEVSFKEQKTHYADNLYNLKLIEEKGKEIEVKDKEIERLKKYIEDNNLSYKTIKENKTIAKDSMLNEYEKKERLNQINMFRLEEE